MKVLLADDHPLFREGVRLVLENLAGTSIEVIEAEDFLTALEIVRRHPDLEIGLVDLNMPGMDGLSGIAAIKRAAPNLHLVVVSASEDVGDIRGALESGASGYICKSAPGVSMIEGIRSVLAGETYLSPQIQLPPMDYKSGSGDMRDLGRRLTPRQRDVLGMVRQGKSNKEIARDLNLAEITVKLHVTAILRTLGVDNRTQAAIVAAQLDV